MGKNQKKTKWYLSNFPVLELQCTLLVLTCADASGGEESCRHTANSKVSIFCFYMQKLKVASAPPLCLEYKQDEMGAMATL